MQRVIIDANDKTKGGSNKSCIQGVWYIVNKNLDAPPTGVQLEIEVGNWHTPDGKDIPTIEKWRRPATVGAPRAPAPSQPPQANPTAGYIGQGFVSNILGNAVAAKTITTPGQLWDWFIACKDCLEGRKPSVPFSDNVREPGMDDDWGPR